MLYTRKNHHNPTKAQARAVKCPVRLNRSYFDLHVPCVTQALDGQL